MVHLAITHREGTACLNLLTERHLSHVAVVISRPIPSAPPCCFAKVQLRPSFVTKLHLQAFHQVAVRLVCKMRLHLDLGHLKFRVEIRDEFRYVFEYEFRGEFSGMNSHG